MEIYVLKSGLCLAIFFGFYKLFLENESMHTFKRFYLLGALFLSLVIPLVSFTTYAQMPVTTPAVVIGADTISFSEIEKTINYWPFVLWSFYATGVLYFSLKFKKNIKQLLSRIKNNPKLKKGPITYVLLKNPVVPHTFLSYVFLNKQKYDAQEIPDEVLQHERVHAKQKHSIDILVVELVQILFWFNPFLYFIKRSIKLNHEFLADSVVLKQGVNTDAYQNLILAFSSQANTPDLANSINYSFIKKRFTVMKTRTSNSKKLFISLLIFPLFIIAIYSFSNKTVVINQIENITNDKLSHIKATEAEIEEYNLLVKKHNDLSVNNIIIVQEEVKRITFLYNKMTLAQRKNAEPFPYFDVIPTPPPAPESPINQEVNYANFPMPVQAPPTPNADSVEYIKELLKRGAVFFIGSRSCSSEEAIDLAKKNKDLKIDVSNYPKVVLIGC